MQLAEVGLQDDPSGSNEMRVTILDDVTWSTRARCLEHNDLLDVSRDERWIRQGLEPQEPSDVLSDAHVEESKDVGQDIGGNAIMILSPITSFKENFSQM